MISAQHGQQAVITSSRRSSVASFISNVDAEEANAKLCVVCGLHFRKAQLAVHQKMCIRNSVASSRRPSNASVMDMTMFAPQSFHYGTAPNQGTHNEEPIGSPEMLEVTQPQYFPCANCKRQILQEKLAVHMKTCHSGASALPRRPPSIPVAVEKQQQNIYHEQQFQQQDYHEPRPQATSKAHFLKPKFMQKRTSTVPEQQSQHVAEYEEDFEEPEQEDDEAEDQLADAAYPLPSVAGGETLYQEVTDRKPCHICGRKFNPDALERHIPACEKLNLKKRKVYDSAKYRAEGTDLSAYLKQNGKSIGAAGKGGLAGKKSTKKKSAYGSEYEEQVIPTLQVGDSKKSNWRTKREQFIRNIRMSKQSSSDTHGERLPPMSSAEANPDYVECMYCSRRFNEHAAERHMPICKASYEKSKMHPSPSKKLPQSKGEALRRRTAYQPPLPGGGAAASSKSEQALPKMKKAPVAKAACCTGCGGVYATEKAKFCFECGTKR